MVVKLFEIRDAGTTIPVMATALIARSEEERWLLRRGGYAEDRIDPTLRDERYIILWPLTGGVATYDPWGHQTLARTYRVAHQFIIERWHDLDSGDVIDVEFILGERTEPKVSERLTVGRM